MDPTPNQLVVRQYERHRCDIALRASVDGAHAEQVGIALQTAGIGPGEFAGTLTDVSQGGLGLRTQLFIPKSAKVYISIETADNGLPILATLKVMRVAMIDRSPTYYLGTSFVEEGTALADVLARLVRAAQSHPATTPMTAAAGGTPRA